MRLLLATLLAASTMALGGETGPWIRVNQLGYLPGAVKVGVLVSKDSGLSCSSFEIHDALTDKVVLRSKEIQRCGSYGPFQSSFRLTFSSLSMSGAYYIAAAGVRSAGFRINSDVYDGTADFLLQYMRQQRCGYNPYLDDSCHTRDGYRIYDPDRDSAFVDVVGGWHDASDYLQYVTTSANAVEQMLFAYEQNPGVLQTGYQRTERCNPTAFPTSWMRRGGGSHGFSR